ncbi:bacteriophage abortive infection AbiH family protein [Providencia rettgeri]|uniref:bacteriophage abortive infection AbiH family protein n=1 Tax=Providencia rettgeri TaxID=587 RepID=UPI00155E7150|nr:bacteriophage abortive infection AbiH family protein [Providencia rettgeri]QKG45314.1 bacteriophage abortive infection AbiH family protein [Providencia rettgeri]QNN31550.1 bacteriophage abortive infection AbiH family protein [Providencia rettgeri]
MSTLFIIGNGFDLFHGLPTRYSDFKGFVEKTNIELFDIIEEYIPAGDDWSELEDALSNIHYENILDNQDMFLPSYSCEDWSDSGHHDFEYETQKKTDKISNDLLITCKQWIHTIITKETLPKLNYIDNNSIYLNFNYTDTLSNVYNINESNIHQIHGNTQSDKIILGHGNKPEKSVNINKGEDQDTRVANAYEIIDKCLLDTYKNTQLVIEQHHFFKLELSKIENIIILGHSISKVDDEYYYHIINKCNHINWYIASLSDNDFIQKKKKLNTLGVPIANIFPINWNHYNL